MSQSCWWRRQSWSLSWLLGEREASRCIFCVYVSLPQDPSSVLIKQLLRVRNISRKHSVQTPQPLHITQTAPTSLRKHLPWNQRWDATAEENQQSCVYKHSIWLRGNSQICYVEWNMVSFGQNNFVECFVVKKPNYNYNILIALTNSPVL